MRGSQHLPVSPYLTTYKSKLWMTVTGTLEGSLLEGPVNTHTATFPHIPVP